MRGFKLFHGYTGKTPVNREAFEILMDTLHEMDRLVEPNRGNYEIPDDEVLDWDVTLSDGLGEE
jgi:hypothetical protein